MAERTLRERLRELAYVSCERLSIAVMLEAADTIDAKDRMAKAWEGLYKERNELWRAAEDKLDKVRTLLERNGCNCECDHHPSESDEDCDPCLACEIGAAVGR
jgi:hypothetical protein